MDSHLNDDTLALGLGEMLFDAVSCKLIVAYSERPVEYDSEQCMLVPQR